MIPYSKQEISPEDIAEVVRILKSDWITRGPVVKKFEEAVAKKVQATYAVAFTSGTAALHGACFAAGVGKGDEVITSALTFASTANVVLWQGAKVVFADIDPVAGNIDPRDVIKKISKRTKAIIAIDYGGAPADLETLQKIANKNNILLIEDAAHALGAVYKGTPVGSVADMTMFSFHPVKPITAGEAGIITTDREDFYQKLLRFRNHGMTRDKKLWHKKDAPDHHYEMLELGLNYWLTDFQAALGMSQLKRLGTFRKKRATAARRYDALFAHTSGLRLPKKDTKNTHSGWHLYPVRLVSRGESMESLAVRRDDMFAKLRAAGIGTQVHYMPVYWHPYYQHLGYKKGLCPKAEQFSLSEFSLPLFPSITTKEQRYIAKTVQEILKGQQK